MMKHQRDAPRKVSDFLFYGFMGLIWGIIGVTLIWACINVFEAITCYI